MARVARIPLKQQGGSPVVALVALAALACASILGLAAWGGARGGGGAVELFSWGSFAKEQASLSKDVEGVISPEKRAAILKNGHEVVQQLHEFEDMVRPRRAEEAVQRRKTVPMDEELAMMKVQRQMRAEHKFPKDRVVGAGDVTAIVNEGDRAMYDEALGRPAPGALGDSKDSVLYENCEDDSLTAEDADLCQRRAGQIKDLTKAAVAEQIADSPPVSPKDRKDRDAAMRKFREMEHAKELAAEALVGREYLQGRMGPGVFKRAKELLRGSGGRQGDAAGVGHESDGDAMHPSSANQAMMKHAQQRGRRQAQRLAAATHDTEAPGKEDGRGARGAAGADGDESKTHVAAAVGGARKHLPSFSMPSKAAAGTATRGAGGQADKGDDDGAAKRSMALSRSSEAGESMGGKNKGKNKGKSEEGRSEKGKSDGGLDFLKDAVENAEGGKDDAKLKRLEGSITEGEASLALKKREFRRELEARQASLMRDFQSEMKEIADGIQLTSGVKEVVEGGGGEGVAATRKHDFDDAESLYRKRAKKAADKAMERAGSSQIIQTIMQRAEQSRLYQHPPRADVSDGEQQGVTKQGEAQTLRSALDRQFQEVSGGREKGAVSGHLRGRRHGAIATQGLRLIAKHGAAPRGRSQRRASSSQAAAAGASGGGGGGDRRKEAFGRDHVGPGSFKELSADATKYLGEAVSQGQPTLQKAVGDALAADLKKGGPQAELHDAETVLCTVERLKTGGCSGASTKGDAAAAGGDADLSRELKGDAVSIRRQQQGARGDAGGGAMSVPHVPTVASIASTLASSIGKFFSRGGMSN
jgi:hypothetical protein